MQLKKLKVLFVQSGGRIGKVKPLVENQGFSLTQIGVDVSYLPVSSGILNYISAIFNLRLRVKNEHFDIVHAHFGLCGIVGLLSFVNTPLVVSFMGDDILGSIRKGKYSFKSKILSLINIFLGKYCYDAVIVKSIKMREKLLVGTSSTVIPNGVDLDNFRYYEKKIAKTRLGWSSDKNYIIFCSDPSRPEKNFELAVKASDLCQSNKIVLVPVYNVPNTEMKYYYSAADCMVLPSFHEGSPNVIKEAMACCCPIVATDVGDVKWLSQGVDGCNISSFQTEDFSNKIVQAIDFAKRSDRTKGRNRILDLGLDSKSVAIQIVELYSKLIKVT